MSTTSPPPPNRASLRARLVAATDLVNGLVGEIGALTDEALVGSSSDLEALARQVDALRMRAAGEIDLRSDRDASGRASEDRLSTRFDCRNGVELLERTTRASVRSLRTRIRLDRRTRTKASLTGEVRPAPYPTVATALREGALGMDAACHLTDEFEQLERRGGVSHEEMAVAEREIVTSATDRSPRDDEAALPETFEEFRVMVGAWSEFLNRNGVEPDADDAERFRGISLGRARDGLVPLRGELVPEAAAGLQRLFDAYAGSTVRFGTSPDDAPRDATWSDTDLIHDPRTAPQKRHDVLVSMIQTSAASTQAPSLGGAAPTLLVTTTVDDVDGGVASIDGTDVPAPASLTHRIACTGAVQKVIFNRSGRIVRLGTTERLFNAHQRRAIGARDGGCVIPGCSIPAAWCEIHHVTEHSHGGTTHTDNGVLLCWAHHHGLEHSGWEIRMHRGVPQVKAPAWIDSRRVFRPIRNSATERERLRRRQRDTTPALPLPIPAG